MTAKSIKSGKIGTTVSAENLFYNYSTRKSSMKVTDELKFCVEIGRSYALHYALGGVNIGFWKKSGKNGQPNLIFKTSNLQNNNEPMKNDIFGSTAVEIMKTAVQQIVSSEISKEIIKFKSSEKVLKNLTLFGCDIVDFFGTKVNYSGSSNKFQFLLFINNRLVESTVLKKVIQFEYAKHLPKGVYPWVYLSVKIKPENLDVNVHPTKKQVNFLYEDEISESIGEVCETVLVGSGESRSLYAMNLISEKLEDGGYKIDGVNGKRTFDFGAGPNKKIRLEMDSFGSSSSRDFGGSKEPQQKEKIRNDPNQRKLTEFNFVKKRKSAEFDIFKSPDESNFSDLHKSINTQEAGSHILEVDKFDMSFSTPKMNEFLPSFNRNDGRRDGFKIPEIYREKNSDVNLSNPEILLSEEETEFQTSSQRLKTLNISQKPKPLNSSDSSSAEEELESLDTLRTELSTIQKFCHKSFLQAFRSWIYVGPISYKFFLVQQECNLNLVRTADLAKEMFYQQILKDFGNFDVLTINNPVTINFDFGGSEVWKRTKIPLDVLPSMLDEYFRIGIEIVKIENVEKDKNSPESDTETTFEHRNLENPETDQKPPDYEIHLKTLPNLFQIKPLLPEAEFKVFLTKLISEINYNNEKESIQSISKLLSEFYSKSQHLGDRNVLQRILAWARINYLPSEKIFTENDTIRPVANLPQLYTVFERC